MKAREWVRAIDPLYAFFGILYLLAVSACQISWREIAFSWAAGFAVSILQLSFRAPGELLPLQILRYMGAFAVVAWGAVHSLYIPPAESFPSDRNEWGFYLMGVFLAFSVCPRFSLPAPKSVVRAQPASRFTPNPPRDQHSLPLKTRKARRNHHGHRKNHKS